MRRSEINESIERAIAFFSKMGFPLPSFAYWTPEEWQEKGPECDEIRTVRLGWDVTDFALDDFPNWGRSIFTLRNGLAGHPAYTKSYAHKVMRLAEGQRSPVHYHRSKREDIINQGGGSIIMDLWAAADDDQLSEEPFEVSVDGIVRRIAAGQRLRLAPGESVCVTPRVYHQFCSEEGSGLTLAVEVSSVCDDLTDNFFLGPTERFPRIEEDEPRRYYLCSEYPPPVGGA